MGLRGPKPRTAQNTKSKSYTGLWQDFQVPDCLDDAEVAEYNRLVANLRRIGTLERTDPEIVVSAACTKVMLYQVRARIKEEGLTSIAGNGTPIPHPLLQTANTLQMRFKGLWSDMGLMASSAKYADPKPEGGDDWGDLLAVG